MVAPGIGYREFILPGPVHVFVSRMDIAATDVVLESSIATGALAEAYKAPRDTILRDVSTLLQDLADKGIMTECCRFLVGYGFRTLDLHRIQIPAATENYRSRAIPERLGFRFEGIMRGRENLYGKFVDHAMYALLRSELPDDLNGR